MPFEIQRLDAVEQTQLIGRACQIAEELATLAPDRTRAILMALLSRIRRRIRPCRDQDPTGASGRAACSQATNQPLERGKPDHHPADVLTLTVMARLQRVGREMRMLVESTEDQTAADPGLLRIIARAHDMQGRLMRNTDLTLHVIASQEGVTAGYVSRLLRLPSLAPDIITAIINGKNSASTHRQKVDATGTPDTGRLDRTAKAARLSIDAFGSCAPLSPIPRNC